MNSIFTDCDSLLKQIKFHRSFVKVYCCPLLSLCGFFGLVFFSLLLVQYLFSMFRFKYSYVYDTI